MSSSISHITNSFSQLEPYFDVLNQLRWRCLWVVSGSDSWVLEQAIEICRSNSACGNTDERSEERGGLWIASGTPDEIRKQLSVQVIPPKNLSSHLGSDEKFVYLDMRNSFDANLLCMASGYVQAGGALVLMLPQFCFDENSDAQNKHEFFSSTSLLDYPDNKSQLDDQFFTRFIDIAKESKHVIWQLESKACSSQILSEKLNVDVTPPENYQALGSQAISIESAELEKKDELEPVFVHAEQKRVVELLKRCAQGHAKRPVVIYADRGRGKSTALGIAAAQLLLEGKNHITITAQHKRQVEVVFKAALSYLDGSTFDGNTLFYQDKKIIFVDLDVLIQVPIQTDFLMVDEAATISVDQLKSISKHYNRLAFSTTVYGYEGTGQGFKQRLVPFLRSQFNSVYEFEIQQPARWNSGDGLEALLNKSCLLDVPSTSIASVVDKETLIFRRLDFSKNTYEEALLEKIYSLMLHSHYRTSPRDLQQLLDDKSILCFTLMSKEASSSDLSALLIIKVEGELDEAICQDIIQGKRRVNGHLLAQSILQDSAHIAIGRVKSARILRIMVDSKLQRKGLATHLLNQARQELKKEGFCFWGTSFGAREDLFSFWSTNQFSSVKLGLKKNTHSGEFSALWMQGLNEEFEFKVSELSERFFDQLTSQLLLNNTYRTSLIYELLKSSTLKHDAEDWNHNYADFNQTRVERYINAELSFEAAFHHLREQVDFYLKALLPRSKLEPSQWALLIEVFYFSRGLESIVELEAYPNRKALEQKIRTVLNSVNQEYATIIN